MKSKYNISERIKELPADKDYFTVTEVVSLTGINRKTILQRLKDGTLKGKKLGNTWRIYRDSLIYEKVDADLNIENEVKNNAE